MLLQIILTVFGLSATFSVGEALSHREDKHWANVMVTEQFLEQFHTHYAEK